MVTPHFYVSRVTIFCLKICPKDLIYEVKVNHNIIHFNALKYNFITNHFKVVL